MRDCFYVPENLNLVALLKEKGYDKFASPNHLDRFYYIIDHIYLTQILRDTANDDYVPLNGRILKEVLTSRWAVPIKKMLVELEVLEEKPGNNNKVNYCPNWQSKHFRFCHPYSIATFRELPATNIKLLQKIEAKRIKRNEAVVLEHPGRQLIKHSIEHLEFDSYTAGQFLKENAYETERQRHRRQIIIEQFDSKTLNFSSDKAGRFYHVFTSCPRDIRPFAKFKGQPLFEIDVSDCQPSLHATLYPPDSVEKPKFVEIVSKGGFKQFINGKLAAPYDLSDPVQKREFKDELFHHVFYGSPYAKATEIADVFAAEFPELDKLIKGKKKYRKRDLPVLMQSREAKVVIDKVAWQLALEHQHDENFCLISIHDCLVTTAPYVDEVKDRIKAGFRDLLGFDLVVKVSPLMPETESALEKMKIEAEKQTLDYATNSQEEMTITE